MTTTNGKPYIKQHQKLTDEQRQTVSGWIEAARDASGLSERAITERAGLGKASLRTWIRGGQVPSRDLLDHLSVVTGHPLPPEVRELGAPLGHFTAKIKARREELRARQNGEKPARRSPAQKAHAALQQRKALAPDDGEADTLPFPDDRKALVSRGMGILVKLAEVPLLDYDGVLAWLNDHAGELTADERMALVRPLLFGLVR